jgi:hypothetical protein
MQEHTGEGNVKRREETRWPIREQMNGNILADALLRKFVGEAGMDREAKAEA